MLSAVFDQLDFIYCPSRDVVADLAHYAGAGGEVVFTVERFQTRVAMIKLTDEGPGVVLAQHLDGDQPILLYRVADLVIAAADLRRRGVHVSERFEFPYGNGVELDNPGPQRVAIYERTRAERGDSLIGRRDF